MKYFERNRRRLMKKHYIRGTQKSVSGTSSVLIDDSAGVPIKMLEIVGKTTQDGTPTPEAYIPIKNANQKSTNLFDESTVTVGKEISADGVEGNNSYQRLSDYIEIEPSTTYRLSDVYNTFTIFDANSAQAQYDRCACYDESKTLISVLFVLSRTQKGQHTTTFTVPENAKYIRITQGKFAEKTMLTKGEAFVPYLPFGDYGSKIVLHGKNLIDDVYNV
ncbi:MAG: hypothetical protein J6A54_00795, partial [Clostridia bacterium]|nr:hypothetical protein [Clostridia bacterium]